MAFACPLRGGEESNTNSPARKTSGGMDRLPGEGRGGRGAGFAPNEVGQINGLGRNYDADHAPRLDKSVRPRVGNEPTAGGLVSSASYVKAPDHALSIG